jgi:hypothetical protein
VVRRVLEMYRRSEHKRVGVKTPEVKPVVDLEDGRARFSSDSVYGSSRLS